MPYTPEQLKSALYSITDLANEDRKKWLYGAQIIHGTFKEIEADGGESLFHDWSRTSPKYKKEDADRAWKWITSRHSDFHAGNLINEARQRGWNEKPQKDNSQSQSATKAYMGDRKRIVEEGRQKKAAEKAEEIERWKKVARQAGNRWLNNSSPCQSHDYLTKKRVLSHGLHIYHGNLLMALYDAWSLQFAGDGRISPNTPIMNLQSIYRDRKEKEEVFRKRFEQGGTIKAGVFPLGRLTATGPICFVEGYATGASVYELLTLFDGDPEPLVLVCMNADNLIKVAEAISQNATLAGHDFLFYADKDESMKGQQSAEKAIKVAGKGKIILPPFRDGEPGPDRKDWNDFFNLYKDELKRINGFDWDEYIKRRWKEK